MSGRFNRTGLFRVALVGCVVVTGGLTGGARASAQGSFTTLVLEGDAAPGTTDNFSILNSSTVDAALIDSNGNVLFEAFLTGSLAVNNAIYRTSGTSKILVAREGGSAPLMGGGADGAYSTFDELVGNVGSNQFLFTSTLAVTGGGPGVDDFLLQENTAASARTGGTAGGDGTLTSITDPFTSDSTEVFFVGGITGAGDGATTGLFQTNGSSFNSIARQGQAAPGTGAGSFVTFDNPTQYDVGGNFVSFYATLTGTTLGTTNDSGIFRGFTTTEFEFVRENDPAPDGLGGTDGTFDTFNPRISGNTANQVAFVAQRVDHSGGSSVDTGVYRATLFSNVDVIIQEGTPLPDGNGVVSHFSTASTLTVPVMNAAGQVAIHQFFTGTTGGGDDNSGILRGDGATLDIIAREDQSLPDGNGRFNFFSGVPQINDGGLVLFFAFLQDTTGGSTDDVAILLGDGEELVIVAREGNEIDGMTITTLVANRSISTEQDRGNRQNVDPLGRVAFMAVVGGSTDGLFRFTPDLHYRRTASGDWDTADNWTLGLNPNDEVYAVFIDPDASPIVTGPSGPVTVPALTIGGGNGAPIFRNNAGGSLTVTGALTVLSGTLDHEQGTLTADSVQNNSNVDVKSGTMVVTNDFVNDRDLDIFDSGDLQVGGQLINNDSVTIILASLSTGAGLVNRADFNFFGGTISGGVVTNEVGSSLDGEGTIDAPLDNNGSMTLTGQLTVTGPITSTGTINIGLNEQLRPDGGLTNSGIINLDGGALAGSGAVTNTASGTIRGGSGVSNPLTNSGVIIADSTNVLTIANLSGGNTGSGELRIEDGSTLSVSAGSLYANAGLIDLMGPGAILAGDDIDNTGNIVGQGRIAGSVNNFGTIRAVGGRLTLAGASNMNNSQGVIEATAGAEIFFSQGLGTQITSIVLSGGTFDNGGNALNNQGSITGHGTLRTGGLTNASAVGFIGVGGGDMSIFGSVSNNNIVEVQDTRRATFFGDVTGSGGFFGTGTVEFLAQFHPGSSPGAITFAGDVVFGALSKLNIELGGATPGSEFDTLTIAGAATLGGTLDVTLIDLGGGIFTPTAGDMFEIISATSILGTFTTETLPALAGGLEWFVNYSDTAVELISTFAGDFDFDGDVDGFDFLEWQRGESPNPLSQSDLADWEANYGLVAPLSATSTAVPEPTTWIGLLIGIMALPFRRGAIVS